MTFVRSIMEPKIIGTAIRLHPLATLVSMLLGVAAFGIIGFLGGPILVIFIVGLAEAFGFQESFKDWTGKILNKISNRNSKSPDGPVHNLRHIVMWKLKDEINGKPKEEISAEIKQLLDPLPESIPQIISLQAGPDSGSDPKAYDFILIVDLADEEALKEYLSHPAHVAAAERINELIVARSAVDVRC